jgi:hypothetical protein
VVSAVLELYATFMCSGLSVADLVFQLLTNGPERPLCTAMLA